LMMPTIKNPILSMRTRTRKLDKSTMLSKYLVKSLKEILSCEICTKNMNRSVKMGVNYSRESLIDG
jgi:hypothetical protein